MMVEINPTTDRIEINTKTMDIKIDGKVDGKEAEKQIEESKPIPKWIKYMFVASVSVSLFIAGLIYWKEEFLITFKGGLLFALFFVALGLIILALSDLRK